MSTESESIPNDGYGEITADAYEFSMVYMGGDNVSGPDGDVFRLYDGINIMDPVSINGETVYLTKGAPAIIFLDPLTMGVTGIDGSGLTYGGADLSGFMNPGSYDIRASGEGESCYFTLEVFDVEHTEEIKVEDYPGGETLTFVAKLWLDSATSTDYTAYIDIPDLTPTHTNWGITSTLIAWKVDEDNLHGNFQYYLYPGDSKYVNNYFATTFYFYGVWAPEPTIQLEHGTCDFDSSDFVYSLDKESETVSITMPESQPVRSGYEFMGWKLGDDWNTDELLANGETAHKALSDMPGLPFEGLTVTAVWKQLTPPLEFVSDPSDGVVEYVA